MTTSGSHREADLVELRKYLLGQLDDAARERVEARLYPVDRPTEEHERFTELLEVAEEEIIDDYIFGELDPIDRQAMALSFTWTTERREKLRLTASLTDLAEGTGDVATRANTARVESGLTGAGAFASGGWAAAAAIAFAAFSLFVFQQLRPEVAPTGQNAVLTTGPSERGSGGGAAGVEPSPSLTRVRLDIGIAESASYRAELFRLEDIDYRLLRTFGGLPALEEGSLVAVPVPIPSDLLRPGSYHVSLYGEDPAAGPSFVGRFDFHVE